MSCYGTQFIAKHGKWFAVVLWNKELHCIILTIALLLSKQNTQLFVYLNWPVTKGFNLIDMGILNPGIYQSLHFYGTQFTTKYGHGFCNGIVKQGTNTLNSFDVAKTQHPVTQSTFVNLLDNIDIMTS